LLPFQGLNTGFVNFSGSVAELGWLYELHLQEINEGTAITGFVSLTEAMYTNIYRYI